MGPEEMRLAVLCAACLVYVTCVDNSLWEQQEQLYQSMLQEYPADEQVGEVELLSDPGDNALSSVEKTDPSDNYDYAKGGAPDPYDPVADQNAKPTDTMANPRNVLPFPESKKEVKNPCFLHVGHEVKWQVTAEGKQEDGTATWTKTGNLGAGLIARSVTKLNDGTNVGTYDLKVIPVTQTTCFAVAMPKNAKPGTAATCITFHPDVEKGESVGCGSGTLRCLDRCEKGSAATAGGTYIWRNMKKAPKVKPAVNPVSKPATHHDFVPPAKTRGANRHVKPAPVTEVAPPVAHGSENKEEKQFQKEWKEVKKKQD